MLSREWIVAVGKNERKKKVKKWWCITTCFPNFLSLRPVTDNLLLSFLPSHSFSDLKKKQVEKNAFSGNNNFNEKRGWFYKYFVFFILPGPFLQVTIISSFSWLHDLEDWNCCILAVLNEKKRWGNWNGINGFHFHWFKEGKFTESLIEFVQEFFNQGKWRRETVSINQRSNIGGNLRKNVLSFFDTLRQCISLSYYLYTYCNELNLNDFYPVSIPINFSLKSSQTPWPIMEEGPTNEGELWLLVVDLCWWWEGGGGGKWDGWLVTTIGPKGLYPAWQAAATAAMWKAAAVDDGPRVSIRIFSISASFNLFSFARRFWNQIFTWVSVRFKEEENSARSAMERYCLVRNFFSKASNWDVVNGVLGLRFDLCLRRVHFTPGRG